jgi:uncharacterized protein YgiM (DUF1202 family)
MDVHGALEGAGMNTLAALQQIGRDLGVDVDAPFIHPQDIRRVTAYYLNVRSRPGASAPIVGSLKVGDLVTVYETLGSWCRIGVNQWVHGDYLSK